MRAAVLLAVLIGVVAAVWSGASGNAPVKHPADPYLWLEDIHGAKPLAWVRAHNIIAEHQLKTDPRYQASYDALLAILDAGDRIPFGQLHGSTVFNFWQDPVNPRGVWRRTTVQSYETAKPEWEAILDIDKLSAAENKNWVYKGSSCSPDLSRCLVSLSPGGGDAIVIREFDMATKTFMADGFQLAEAKSGADYIDNDTILFGTDFGPGSLTNSGYPRVVKMWRRGQAVAAAKTVYEAKVEDVSADGILLNQPEGTIPLISRGVDFFTTEYFSVRPDGSTIQIPLPDSADVKGATRGQIVATLRKDWTPDGGAAIKQGSLIAFSLADFLSTGKMPAVAVLYTPDARGSIDDVSPGRDAVYAATFENVVGSVHAFRYDAAKHAWSDIKIGMPPNGATGIVSSNDFGPEALFTYEGFLAPTTLYADNGDGKPPRAIEALPARFDATPYAVAQYEAVSKDGTHIPYFVVRNKTATGPAPTLLYGYGGFEISQTPWYWASAGRVWLGQGGQYAVANIRGGGEFGPAWHEAALKLNRQRAYDDFIAISEDMVRRGLTTPKQLGIMGGSNGGLLVGAVAVERPELFGAVVCEVPLLDMIRYVKIGAGASWVAEYGDPAIPEERSAILRYSPYQNVRRDGKYPPIFFVTATSDDRVTPVHARKMAARMLAQGHDVLFFENTDGGHAASANHKQAAEMSALAYVYLAQKLGLTARPTAAVPATPAAP